MTDMERLIQAITAQTAAITALVESNARLMMILADGATDEDVQVQTYMDGSPVS